MALLPGRSPEPAAWAAFPWGLLLTLDQSLYCSTVAKAPQGLKKQLLWLPSTDNGADVTVATVTRWRQGYKKAAAGHQSDLERVSGGAFGGDSPALLGQGLSKRSPSSCAMSATEEMAPDSMEQACMLCRRAEADPGICGRKLQKHGLCAHEFCLFFANQLFRQWDEDEGFRGFVPEDIRRAIRCAERKYCFVCGESGATITCSMMGCRRSFHLPCAGEGGCVTQFLSPYRSLCWEHRPEQAVEAAPEENTTCLICLEPVGDQKSYGTMVCPACKHAWFHRGCIQAQALNAGIFCFRCPLCRDRSAFLPEMLIMGIRMPFSLPSWEDGQAYAGERERHSRCDASVCLCPGGREQAEEGGPWELLLCSSCAAEGTHRHCSSLSSSTASWECDSCAGLGTASSATSELAGPSTPGQALPSGSSCGSPALEGSSGSSTPGPTRVRALSRAQRRAPDPYSRPRRTRRTRSPAPAPSAESSTPSLPGLDPSHRSPAPETSSPSTASQLPSGSSCDSPALESGSRSSSPGPVRIRGSSRVQRRAQNPYSRPRRRRGTSCAPSPSAGPDAPPPGQ
ncbi:PHD finger protein 7-like [Rissa tridactyla]|uniref:PHD finger protein 7-like n=1 Tax=Rissa tridactyla TaxID=75485 RepID=UPI0023BB10C0|nr:PHD finger protein 7-like [Rissa tridactyla]